jgi:hypothetical protein
MKTPINQMMKAALCFFMFTFSVHLTAQCGWQNTIPYNNNNPVVSQHHNALYQGDKYFYIEESSQRIANIFGGTWMHGVLDNSSPQVRGNTRFEKHPTNSDLYYVGTNNKLYKTYWNGSAWTTTLMNANATEVRWSSQITLDKNNDIIYYVDIYGDFRGITTSGSLVPIAYNIWIDPNHPIFSAGYTDLFCDNTGRVWFSDHQNRISCLYNNTSGQGWPGWNVIYTVPLNEPTMHGTSPIVVNQYNEVFYVSSNNHLISFDGGSQGTYNQSWSRIGSSLVGGERFNLSWGEDKLVFATTSRVVRNVYRLNGVWQDNQINANVISTPSPISIGQGEIVYTDNISGTIRLRAYKWYSCKTGNPATSTDLASEKAEFTFYPNPATASVTLENRGVKEMNVKLFSMTGQQVKDLTIAPASTMKVDLDGLTSGVYLLKWVSDAEIQTNRLLVQ